MGSRKTLILVAAIAIGALAAFVLRGYVGGIEDRAAGDVERVSVLRIDENIPRGVFGEEAAAAISDDEIPRQFYPANAVTELGRINGLVAVNDLAANQILVEGMFVDPEVAQSTTSDRLEQINGEDMTAITISVDEVRGVAGLLVPGDFVNIILTDATVSSEGAEGAEGEPQQQQTETRAARYLYQKVKVLYVDQSPVPQPGEVQEVAEDGSVAAPAPENKGLLTLLVPAAAAQEIASASPEQLYLTLVAPDYTPVPQQPLAQDAPFPGEDSSLLTPYGPDGATAPEAG